MASLSPTVIAPVGLIGGFVVARRSRRSIGGAVFVAAGAACAWQWQRRAGTPAAVGLGLGYTAAMGLSHPLARRLGAWGSVLTVAGLSATASGIVTRSRSTAG